MPPKSSAVDGIVSAIGWNSGEVAVSAAIGSPSDSQRPSRVMPIGTISYRAGSSAPITVWADRSETSCSSDCPPKITATRIRPSAACPP